MWNAILREMKKAAPLVALTAFAANAGSYTYLKGPTLIESTLSVYLNVYDYLLTKDSNTNIVLSGPGTSQVYLPHAPFLPEGRRFRIKNEAAQAITLNLYDGTDARVLPIQSSIEAILMSNGTSNGTWAIDQALSLYVDSGGVVFGNSTNNGISYDTTNFYWDNVLKSLRLGSGVHAERLDVYGGRAFHYTNNSSTGNIDAASTSGIAAIRFIGAATLTLRGIANGTDGKEVTLTNVSGGDMTISNQHGTPTASNRIITGTGADMTVSDGASVLAKYDGSTLRWRIIGGSGGNGSSAPNAHIEWSQFADAPTVDLDLSETFGNPTYAFAFPGGFQFLFGEIRVPDSYTPGNPIKLKFFFLSFATSNTVGWNTFTKLFRPSTDDYVSSGNNHVSTPTAITMTSGNDSTYIAFTTDLSDSSGQLTGVSVQPGDVLKVRLSRSASDTSTQDAYLPSLPNEVTFE